MTANKKACLSEAEAAELAKLTKLKLSTGHIYLVNDEDFEELFTCWLDRGVPPEQLEFMIVTAPSAKLYKYPKK